MKDDPVNHPAHYIFGAVEVIDAIDAWKLGFSLGNAVKYIVRCEHKDKKLEDLKQARWYLDHEIGRLEGVTKTKAEIRSEIAAIASEHLGVDAGEAFRRLDAGELDGTVLEVELKTRRFLLGEDPNDVTTCDEGAELRETRAKLRKLQNQFDGRGDALEDTKREVERLKTAVLKADPEDWDYSYFDRA